MASNHGTKPPTERARAALAAALTMSDENGNTCSYDVWPYANAWHRVSLIHVETSTEKLRDQWPPELTRLVEHHIEAKARYRGPLLRDPDRQQLAAETCLKLKEEIDAGDGGAVLEAIAKCAAHGLVIPSWLAVAFVSRYNAVASGDARSWNDDNAFGPALEKGANARGVKAMMQMAPWAYEVAKRLLAEKPTRPIDAGFYAIVAKEIGSSQTNVQTWIRKIAGSNGVRVPLKYFKERLLAGRNNEEAERDWDDKRFLEWRQLRGVEVTCAETDVPTENHKKSKRK